MDTAYQMTIKNLAAAIKLGKTNAFDASYFLALAFGMSKETAINDLLEATKNL